MYMLKISSHGSNPPVLKRRDDWRDDVSLGEGGGSGKRGHRVPLVPSTMRCARSSRYEAFVSKLQYQLTRADPTMFVSSRCAVRIEFYFNHFYGRIFKSEIAQKCKRERERKRKNGPCPAQNYYLFRIIIYLFCNIIYFL